MNKSEQKLTIFKEKEKIEQVTHWDLDYLPQKAVQDLYRQEKFYSTQGKNRDVNTIAKNNRLPLGLMAAGLLLLAGSLYIGSLL